MKKNSMFITFLLVSLSFTLFLNSGLQLHSPNNFSLSSEKFVTPILFTELPFEN